MEETYPDSEDPTIGDRVVGALEFLVELGVDMINLSLSTLSHISIREALDDALDQGVLLIAAAGNSGHNSLKFPASHHDVVAVSGFGHVDHTPPDTISHVQNKGKLNAAVAAGRTLYPGQLSNYDRKSIWFPGVGIISTFPDANGLTGRFKELDGTSMACALASGNIGALLISPEGPLDTPRCPSRLIQIRNILNQQLRDGGDGIFPVFP
jgi:subtilisin